MPLVICPGQSKDGNEKADSGGPHANDDAVELCGALRSWQRLSGRVLVPATCVWRDALEWKRARNNSQDGREAKQSLEISPCVYLQSTEEEPSTSRIARRSALTEQKSGTGFVTCGGRRIANSGQNRLDAGKSTPKEGARKESDCHTGLLCSESSDQPLCDDQQEPTRPGYCGIFLEISWRSWSVLVIPRAPWRLSP